VDSVKGYTMAYFHVVVFIQLSWG